jgi:5-hydroxyisourate hydrolase
MSAITTHVLDTVLGKPGAGIAVRLDIQEDGNWKTIGSSSTDQDGRCKDLAPNAEPGIYRLTFHTAAYFAGMNRKSIYPEISIAFQCGEDEHYHLPLLLSDNSYTTYRGS